MKKLPKKASAVATTTESVVARCFGQQKIIVDAVYFVKDIAPPYHGPWTGEADKVAWTDARTGYGCIIRRSAFGGHLCGYVGVGPDHPLYGFEASACRDVGIRAHGGINYAKECERYEVEEGRCAARYEAVSICHIVKIREASAGTTKASRTVLEVKPHDDLWWIGFECDGGTDFIPNANSQWHEHQSPAGTAERQYRDEAYVFDQCLWLAEQLKAVEDGGDLAAVEERWTPAAGYNSRNGED